MSTTKAKHSIAKLPGHGRMLGVAGGGQVDGGRFRKGGVETGVWLIRLELVKGMSNEDISSGGWGQGLVGCRLGWGRF